eukprot:TRINITY_DN1046_c0_g1_i3.p1 TRINITY_DN1046_c0_g1~~TRINITY_DN1046_c0_g1_i3.p1  ORF type:complete len:710 (+),score=157.50 TRINITY_DN1046_c0_g1_i3:234-2132(+)
MRESVSNKIDKLKFVQEYFKDDRRKISEHLYPLARNYANWEFKENEKALGDTFAFLFTDIRNGQVPMIDVVGGSGSGKSFLLDSNAEYLNERDFDKFGKKADNNEKRNAQFLAINISFSGNTNSDIVSKLMGQSKDEKERILEREAALRIIFSFFQKRVEYGHVKEKWFLYYEKMRGIDLRIEDALKIVIEDAYIQDSSIKDKKAIVVIGIDEISRLDGGTKNYSVDMRSLICRASDRFYQVYTNDKGEKFDKLQVRMIFTSFLPTQTPQQTKSLRQIKYACIKSLSQETVIELMGKYYDVAAFKAAINCCVGHQRSLEELYQILMEGEKQESELFRNSVNENIYDDDGYQLNIFKQVIRDLCIKMGAYSGEISWELLEPSLTGRGIVPINKKYGKDQIKFTLVHEHPIIDGKHFKNPYSLMFANGIFVNSLTEEFFGESIVPQTTPFWLHLWNRSLDNVVKDSMNKNSENEMEKRLVFVEDFPKEKDLIKKHLSCLLAPIGWDPLRYEVYSSRLFAFKLELARCRTKEMSLYDFFNGSLRWNPESIDAREIIIQFSNSPISLSSCNNLFSTLIKHDPSALKIGKAIVFNGNNPGFHHCFPLHCKIEKKKNLSCLLFRKSTKASSPIVLPNK